MDIPVLYNQHVNDLRNGEEGINDSFFRTVPYQVRTRADHFVSKTWSEL